MKKLLILLITFGLVASAKAMSLHDAASNGDNATIERLLTQKADVNAQNDEGETALHRAPHFMHETTADLLLQHGANPNVCDVDRITPVHIAACLGSAQIMETLIKHGAVLEAQIKKTLCTPLHHAARSGNFKTAEALLLHGAQVNPLDSFKQTPLHLAAYQCPDIVSLLLSYGADTTGLDACNRTALIIAYMVGNQDIIRRLIQANKPQP